MRFTKYSLVLGSLLIGSSAWSLEGAPTSMNVQGKLTATGGGPVTAGNYTFAFKLFDVSAGGTQVWPPAGSENHILALATDGLWTALLGKDFALLSDLVDDTARYLEITITPPVGSAETFGRIRLSSTPFTLEAGQLNGRTGDAYVETAGDVMTGRLQIDYGSNGTDIDLRQDGGTTAIVELSSGGSLKCQLVADTKGHLVLADNSGDVTAILDATPSGGGVLDLNQEDGTDGALLSGGTTSNGATLDLNNSGGAVAVKLDAQETQGGKLELNKSDGTLGAALIGDAGTSRGRLNLYNSVGALGVWLDAKVGNGGRLYLYDIINNVTPRVILHADGNGSLSLSNSAGNFTAWLRTVNEGLLDLYQEDGTPGATFSGGTTSNGGMIDLRNSGGSIAVNVDAQETQGGMLNLYHEDGTDGVTLMAGTTAVGDAGTLRIRNELGNVRVYLDGSDGSHGVLYLNKENGAIGAKMLSGTTTSGAVLGLSNAAGSEAIHLAADPSANSYINSGADFGIGTAAPDTRLHIVGGTDASLSNGSGYVVLGAVSSANLVIDNNEIQARNNGAASSLYLQAGGGNVGIGTPTTQAKLDVNESGATVAIFNRNTDDGTVIAIKQADLTEGTISVSGNTVSYNAFTGSHYGWTDEPIERGMLVMMTGVTRNLHDAPGSEVIYGIATSTQANDPRCLGAYLSLSEPSEPAGPENPHLVMAVGNGEMWVADAGEDIQVGDYLISSDVSGHAMKDTDRFPVSYIIARAAESVNWAQTGETVAVTRHKKISVLFESFVHDRGAASAELTAKVTELEKSLAAQTGELENLKQIVSTLTSEGKGSESRFAVKP